MSGFPIHSSLLTLLLLISSTTLGAARDYAALDAAAGKALFERNWVSAPASTASSDGLGPYYNARSCAACHAGGSGSSAMSHMNFVIADPVYGGLLQTRAVAGLAAEARIAISDHSVSNERLDGKAVVLRKPVAVATALSAGVLHSAISMRRAPLLLGLSYLEQVTPAQLHALADPDDANGDGISGRVAGTEGAGKSAAEPGRFGWKADTASLRIQTAKALALDLGLGNPLLPGAAGDCTADQAACQAAAHPGSEPEVSEFVLNLMLAYLAALPMPQSPSPDASDAPEMFSALGCAACHVPQLDSTAGPIRPFSDLLLHDMGPGLAGGPDGVSATAAEWRTAPLWGLRQTDRYLHDARAASLEEAVLWHGGEAAASVAAYRSLNAGQRQLLHRWLLGL